VLRVHVTLATSAASALARLMRVPRLTYISYIRYTVSGSVTGSQTAWTETSMEGTVPVWPIRRRLQLGLFVSHSL